MRESAVWSLSKLSGAPVPTRLLFAPQDLRTADPTIATDIYSGFFAFSGRAITTGGRSPFAFTPPSRAWQVPGPSRRAVVPATMFASGVWRVSSKATVA